MADIPWHHPAPPIPWRQWARVTPRRILLLAVAISIILIALNWSAVAVLADSQYRQCDSKLNRFS